MVAPFTSTAKLEAAGVAVFNDLEKTRATFVPLTELEDKSGPVKSAYTVKVLDAVFVFPAMSVYLLEPRVNVVVPVVVGVNNTLNVVELVVDSAETVAPFVALNAPNVRPYMPVDAMPLTVIGAEIGEDEAELKLTVGELVSIEIDKADDVALCTPPTCCTTLNV